MSKYKAESHQICQNSRCGYAGNNLPGQTDCSRCGKPLPVKKTQEKTSEIKTALPIVSNPTVAPPPTQPGRLLPRFPHSPGNKPGNNPTPLRICHHFADANTCPQCEKERQKANP